MSLFSRYIGIDYSGAETPTASLKGLRAYVASESEAPLEVPHLPSPAMRVFRGSGFCAGRTPDQQDAYTVSRRLQEADLAGNLGQFFQPSLTEDERAVADIEGWILGVA